MQIFSVSLFKCALIDGEAWAKSNAQGGGTCVIKPGWY